VALVQSTMMDPPSSQAEVGVVKVEEGDARPAPSTSPGEPLSEPNPSTILHAMARSSHQESQGTDKR